MADDDPGASIFLFFLFLIIDIFFYGFGAAITSLNGKDIERKAQEKDKKALRLAQIMDAPGDYVNTLQLTVTFVNLVMGFLYLNLWKQEIRRLLDQVLGGWLQAWEMSEQLLTVTATVLTFLILIYILLTFGVLLPKRIAARAPEKWAYACVNAVDFVTMLLKPLTGLVTATTEGILYLLGFRQQEDEADVTEEEIISMVQEGHEQGVIQASEAEMISNIFEYGDKEAQDIMTHRNNIVSIDAAVSLQDAIAFMLAGKNSRYPVYEENIDHIIGILHLKDALRFRSVNPRREGSLGELRELLREPYFVPQTKNIDELFQEMQSKKLQMVIVVDEYGQTDGLVAMEDILEEIVGNILDEYDEEQEYIEDKGNDQYVMEGKTPLKELEELLDISFEDEEYETLNGFLTGRLDHIPEPGEEFAVDYQGYHFKILSVQNKVIQSILVTKLPDQTKEAAAE